MREAFWITPDLCGTFPHPLRLKGTRSCNETRGEMPVPDYTPPHNHSYPDGFPQTNKALLGARIVPAQTSQISIALSFSSHLRLFRANAQLPIDPATLSHTTSHPPTRSPCVTQFQTKQVTCLPGPFRRPDFLPFILLRHSVFLASGIIS